MDEFFGLLWHCVGLEVAANCECGDYSTLTYGKCTKLCVGLLAEGC